MRKLPVVRLAGIVLALVWSFVSSLPAQAALRFVSPGGTGTTCSTGVPCALAEGLTQAVAGDEVVLKDGTYPGAIETVRSGAVGQPIVIRAENRHLAVLEWPHPDNRVDQNVEIRHSDITVRSLRLDGRFLSWENLRVRGPDVAITNVIIEDTQIVNSGRSGLVLGWANTVTVRQNFLDHSGHVGPGEGIAIASAAGGAPVNGVEIYGNTIHRTTSTHIALNDEARNIVIYNNILALDTETTESMVQSRGAVPWQNLDPGNVFRDNIVRNSSDSKSAVVDYAGNRVDTLNNVFHDIVATVFVDALANSLMTGNTLCETTSVNIPAGNTLGAPQAACNSVVTRILDAMACLPTFAGTPPCGPPSAPAIRYTAPVARGLGNCTSDAHACTNQAAVTLPLPCGETIRLTGTLDAGTGLYVGAEGDLDFPAGAGVGCEGTPILVDAVTPNGPMVSGDRVRPPLRIIGVSNITVRDVRLKDGLVSLAVVGSPTTMTANITLERIRAYDGAWGSPSGMGLSIVNASPVTVRDSVFLGRFRKAMQVEKAPPNANILITRNLFLRFLATASAHVVSTGSCSKGTARFYNNIVMADELAGSASTSHESYMSPDHWAPAGAVAHCGALNGTFEATDPILLEYKGNIGYRVTGQQVPGLNRTIFTLSPNPAALQTGVAITSVAEHNLTIRRPDALPQAGIAFFAADTTPAGGTSTIVADHWTDDVGPLATNKTTDDGAVTLASLGGDVLQYTGNCAAPAASGAQIKCRYTDDGTLSTTPLWPWPYAAEIAAFLAESPYGHLGLDHGGLHDINVFMQHLTGATFGTVLALKMTEAPASQPTTTALGTAIPAFRVCAFDEADTVVGSVTEPITLGLDSGAGALSGTLETAPVHGCATFSDVVPDTLGAKTLAVSAPGLVSGTSASFTVQEAPVAPSTAILYWVQ